MQTLNYTLPEKAHEVEIRIGTNGLREEDFWRQFSKGKRIAVIADEAVVEFVANPLLKLLPEGTHLFTIPSGEGAKSREEKAALEDALLRKGYGKDTFIVAIGGGVASDLIGFLAATYCRGVPWMIVPTTLLAMVDAAIGGKTAINTPYGKNLIGAIHHPSVIFIDIDTLASLPDAAYKSGLPEAIKHGILFDAALFDFMKSHKENLFKRDPLALKRIIKDSCRLKGEVVTFDNLESGKRRLLNFGHTVGHALEALSDYRLSHGLAVAHGMRIESRYLTLKKLMSEETLYAIETILDDYGFFLPKELPPFDALWEAMTHDKKAKNGLPRLSGVKAIGEPLTFEGAYCTEIDPEIFRDLYHNLPA